MTYNDMFLIWYVSLVGLVLLTAWTCNIRDWYQRGRIPDFKTSLISSTCLTKLDPELLKNYPFNTSGHSSTKTRNRTSRQFLFFIFHCLSVRLLLGERIHLETLSIFVCCPIQIACLCVLMLLLLLLFIPFVWLDLASERQRWTLFQIFFS